MQVILSDGSQSVFRRPGTGDPRGALPEIDPRGRDLSAHGCSGAQTRPTGTSSALEPPEHWRRRGGYNLDRFVDGNLTFKVPPDPSIQPGQHGLRLGRHSGGDDRHHAWVSCLCLPERTALALVHFDRLHEALTAVPVPSCKQTSPLSSFSTISP